MKILFNPWDASRRFYLNWLCNNRLYFNIFSSYLRYVWILSEPRVLINAFSIRFFFFAWNIRRKRKKKTEKLFNQSKYEINFFLHHLRIIRTYFLYLSSVHFQYFSYYSFKHSEEIFLRIVQCEMEFIKREWETTHVFLLSMRFLQNIIYISWLIICFAFI